MDKETVFVLGAGFTRAFDSKAPLLHWDLTLFFDILQEKYKKFPKLLKTLDALKTDELGSINIEALLSRLYSGMPYDKEHLSEGERMVLYEDIYAYFLEELKKIEIEKPYIDSLKMFSKFVIENEITCLTFNYDTLLDKSLSEYKTAVSLSDKYWHPDGGYSFFCRPSDLILREGIGIVKDETAMVLLKLHGSLNWMIKKGFQRPYPLEALIHSEDWLSPTRLKPEDLSVHLEHHPFVVPPVLDKTLFNEQPILKVLWENAYKKLSAAKNVVFLGYSFPKTDIAAAFLFKEAIDESKVNIVVVNRNGREKIKKEQYKEVFPNLKDGQFNFEGVLDWVNKNCIVKKEKKT